MGDLPAVVGSYRVVRLLGEGGMGAVFEAVHDSIGRRVAIKVLHPEFARNQDLVARFFNEARAVNLIEHPGLVQISDYGQLPDGTAYIVMEFLKGESLGQRLKRTGGSLPIAEALQIAWQLADSLAAAHSKGIVHRDLKPDNVMIVPDPHMPLGERTKLVDFGIAKLTQTASGSAVRTRTNTVMGTPLYMSPEQCRGAGHVDDRSDVYSLGVMLYQMLAGRPPFLSDAPGDLMVMHMRDQPPSIRNHVPSLPLPVVNLFDGLLAKEPAARPSMHQLVPVLARLQSLPSPLGNTAQPAVGHDSSTPTTLVSAIGQSQRQGTIALGVRPHLWPRIRALALGLALITAIAAATRSTWHQSSPPPGSENLSAPTVGARQAPVPKAAGITTVSQPSTQPSRPTASAAAQASPSLDGAPSFSTSPSGHNLAREPELDKNPPPAMKPEGKEESINAAPVRKLRRPTARPSEQAKGPVPAAAKSTKSAKRIDLYDVD